jgi:hypothetical protein
MPNGNELKLRIPELLTFSPASSGKINGDKLTYSAISLYSRDGDCVNSDKEIELMNAAVKISMGMHLSISIDNYIGEHGGDIDIAFCGKLAITRAILEAKRRSDLSEAYDKDRFQPVVIKKTKGLDNSWYPLLFQKITEGCRIDELTARLDDISFIIFNYDRCFEYFMYNALIVYYDISPSEAKTFVQNLHINHPYGTVGDLWSGEDRTVFGDTPGATRLIKLAMGIKTFTESREREKDMKNRVQYLVERADRIIFLGFAYHEQNIDMLFNHHDVMYDKIPLSENAICYGTGYQISADDLPYVRNSLMQANKRIKECYISDVTCTRFFQDFWYRLSFKPTQTDQDDSQRS